MAHSLKSSRHIMTYLLLSSSLSTAALAQDDSLYLGTLVLNSDRAGGTVLDLPANVTVVDEETLDTQDVNDLEDLVRSTPGVTISRQVSGADPFSTIGGITIRGVGGNRVGLQVDGSRVAERITDGTRDYFDFSFTKQAEIVRGPASVQWGADSLGGLLTLSTIDPEDLLNGRARGGQAKLSFDGVDNRMSGEVALAQRLSPSWTVMLGYKQEESHELERSKARNDGGSYGCPRNVNFGATPCGEYDPQTERSQRVLAKAVWTPNDAHRFEFSADYLKRDTQVDQKYDLGPVISMRTGQPTGAINNRRDREMERSRARYGVEHIWTPAQGWLSELKTTFAFTPHSNETRSEKHQTSPTGEEILTKDRKDYFEDFYELDIQGRSEFATGGLAHELLFGFDGDVANTDYKRVSRNTNLTTGASSEARAGGFNFANAKTTRADIYLEDRMTFGDFELTPGLRYATYKIEPEPDADYSFVDGAHPKTREDSKLLYSLGARYQLSDTLSVWAKYGQGFKMPTAQQLFLSSDGFFKLVPAPDLKPESSDTYEIGMRFANAQGYFAINAFQSDYKDFIASNFDFAKRQLQYQNRAEVKIRGLEASGEWGLSDVTSVGFSAAWQEGTQKATKDADRKTRDLLPWSATLSVEHMFPAYDLSVQAVANLVGKVKETNDDNGFKPDGYTTVDLYGQWQVFENASLNVGVQNLFDKRYFTSGAIGRTTSPSASVASTVPLELYTGAGRSLQVGLSMDF